eukprot:3358787-Alexandrium_andersonii.AAC.1
MGLRCWHAHAAASDKGLEAEQCVRRMHGKSVRALTPRAGAPSACRAQSITMRAQALDAACALAC